MFDNQQSVGHGGADAHAVQKHAGGTGPDEYSREIDSFRLSCQAATVGLPLRSIAMQACRLPPI